MYLGARHVFEAHGASIVGIPIDADGLDTDRLAQRLASGWRPRFVCTVANFSNPSGATLTIDRRARLAALAQGYGFAIVEDDPYHALGFDGARPDPISCHAPDHAWFGVESRCLRAASGMAPRAGVDVRRGHARGADALPPHPGPHPTRRARTLRAALDGVVTTPMPEGGMLLWGRAAVDTRAAFERAIDAGVAYIPGDAFSVDRPGTKWLRMSSATLGPEHLTMAARRLDTAFGTATLLA